MSLVCINPEGLVDSILFSLGIFKFFSSYGTYFRIEENQRAKILQDERERLKNMYSIPWEHDGRLLGRREWYLYYQSQITRTEGNTGDIQIGEKVWIVPSI